MEPTILAVMELLKQMTSSTGIGVKMFLDLHAYASRKTCYALSYPMEGRVNDQIDNWMFASFMQMNTPFFDSNSCVIGKQGGKRKKSSDRNRTARLTLLGRANQHKKDGTGRVAVSRLFEIPHCYTIEASCNMADQA